MELRPDSGLDNVAALERMILGFTFLLNIPLDFLSKEKDSVIAVKFLNSSEIGVLLLSFPEN